MTTFSIYVDGSNLLGSLQKVNLRVPNYENFFKFIFEESVETWKSCMIGTPLPTCRMQRINWYALGSVDDIDTTNSTFKASQKENFNKDLDLKKKYMALVSKDHPALNGSALFEKAWDTCFAEACVWYSKKRDLIKGFQEFYFGLQRDSDFIDVISCGHWKVSFLEKYVVEKGLDTRLAIDSVLAASAYDVALIVSGDADVIPSFAHVKNLGKQIGSIEIIKGHPPETKGRQFSSRLKVASDFVVQIYETDLINKKIATRYTAP